MRLSPELFMPILASVAAGLLMLESGMLSNLLKLRRTTRRCASCSRHFEGPVCKHCAGRA